MTQSGRLGAVYLVVGIICAWPVTAESQAPTPSDTADELRAAISERLSVMPAVAQYKWNRRIPVEDLAREKVIIESLAAKARNAGIAPSVAEQFFKDQIDAAKIIQRTLIAQWRVENQPAFANVPDLKTAIRPQLDTLTARLMNELARFLAQNRHTNLAPLLDPIPPRWASQPEIWQTAVRSLRISTSR